MLIIAFIRNSKTFSAFSRGSIGHLIDEIAVAAHPLTFIRRMNRAGIDPADNGFYSLVTLLLDLFVSRKW